jgi:M6 family metalloprotease-like protein
MIPLGAVAFVAWCLSAAESAKIDLSDYRTVDKAVTAKITPSRSGQTGYLGVAAERDTQGRLVVEEVQADSPAAKAGLKKGDLVTRVGDHPVHTPQAFREWLQTYGAGDSVKIGLLRQEKPVEVSATLTAVSRPMKVSAQRAVLGVQFGEAKEGDGVLIDQVTNGSPAADAGLKKGDHIRKIDGTDVPGPNQLSAILSEKKPGDVVKLTVRREAKDLELKATLGTDRGGRGGRGGRDGGGGRGGPASFAPWTKDVFRLAVVRLEFADVKHNDKVSTKDWEDAFFSTGTYKDKKNATGQSVHGSLNDYYREQSCGALRVEGKVFEWVQLSKKRGDYVEGSGTSNKTAPLTEALDKVTARDGKDVFKDFDGYLFIYAGERVQSNRGAVYYPHAGSIGPQGRRLPYLLGAEGGSRMTTISGFVKEFGQVIGLPDLAARPENAGSRGLGAWCAMSNPLGDGRPEHLCAWSKEKLGWLKPTIIDPTVKQKLVLSPVEDSSKECFKVLVRPDGSEYLLLENRKKKGFDTDLPAEGLLIWRVVNDRPSLHESHGVDGPTAPIIHLGSVPFPSEANRAFTPGTTPSSRSPHGGGLPVHITEIRRLPDGRITFQIGYEYR